MKRTFEELSKREKVLYLNSWGGLYGDKVVEPTEIKPKKPKPLHDANIRSEHQEQCAFVHWLRTKTNYLFYASANGGKRDPISGAKLKASGVRKGVPDIMIAEPHGQYHGLYIEMKKTKGGVVSDEQKWWLQQLKQRGYRALVAYGCDEAIRFTNDYFRNG
jgi:hypothetical protein